jgi:hypothetical protein
MIMRKQHSCLRTSGACTKLKVPHKLGELDIHEKGACQKCSAPFARKTPNPNA